MKLLLFRIKMLLGIRNHNRRRNTALRGSQPISRAEWFAVQRVIRKVGAQ